MKRIEEPLLVRTREGVPDRLVWRGRPYKVESIEAVWRVDGRWWLRPVPACRSYYRVQASQPGQAPVCLELYTQAGQWALSRIAD